MNSKLGLLIIAGLVFALDGCEQHPLNNRIGNPVSEANSVEEFGVVRAWQSGNDPEEGTIRPGRQLIVEVKNYQGWLQRKIEVLRITKDTSMGALSPELEQIINNGRFEMAILAAGRLVEAAKVAGLTLEEAADKWLREPTKDELLILKGEYGDTREALEANRNLLLAIQAIEAKGREAAAKNLLAAQEAVQKNTAATAWPGSVLRIWMLRDSRQLLPLLPSAPAKRVAVLTEAMEFSRKLFHAKRAALQLKINHYLLTGVLPLDKDSPEYVPLASEQRKGTDTYHRLSFMLEETPETASIWQQLRRDLNLGGQVRLTLVTNLGDYNLEMNTCVNLSVAGLNGNMSGLHPLRLEMTTSLQLIGAIMLVSLVVGFCIWRGATTDLLCDSERPSRPDGLLRFSLGRTQMAFWFLTIVATFLFLWVVTGNIYVLNQTCLWLIGIGSGTALGAAVIAKTGDSTVVADPPWQWTAPKGWTHHDVMRRFEYFQRILDASDVAPWITPEDKLDEGEKAVRNGWSVKRQRQPLPSPLDADEKCVLLNKALELRKQMNAARTMRGGAVGWFFEDILTEGDRYSFHKYQMMVWTLVSGLIFIFRVIEERKVPDFDTTMLALMGISSGTYLGFKLPPARNP